MAKLIIFEESEDNSDTIFETYELPASRVLVGSDPDNHLILEAPDIDPTHASLELRDQGWILQDLGGPGGTAVNGQVIEGPYNLHHDDLIELGFIKMKFQDAEPTVQENASPGGRADERSRHMSGRIWFAVIAGATLVVIFVILLILIIADYLGLLKLIDLLPPWLGA